MTKKQSFPAWGVPIGLSIITLWLLSTALLFRFDVGVNIPFIIIFILLQTHLFTGLFITAHDAMHGAVSPKNPKLNHFIGKVCATLFIFNSYKKLRPNHYLHHRKVGTEGDPDFHRGNDNFFIWYFHFLTEYVSLKQILLAAITFNILKFGLEIPQLNLILFWIIPSILSTFQLFYFGTYVPHKGDHDAHNIHKSSTQKKNHLLAFLSCYFFGYHYEHHDSPTTPWWMLWKEKA